jgi:uncharacterized protein (TIGR02996 family)
VSRDYRDDPDYQRLYQAIIASPFDQLPRLVLADWLEEFNPNLQMLAACMRVPLELVSPTQAADLQDNGLFIAEITLTSQQFIDHAHEIVKRHPVRRWVLSDARVERMMDLSWIALPGYRHPSQVSCPLDQMYQTTDRLTGTTSVGPQQLCMLLHMAKCQARDELDSAHFRRLDEFLFHAARCRAGLPWVEYHHAEQEVVS